MDKYQISERSACGLVGLSRTTWRHLPIPRDDETPMRAEVIRLATTYGRYGYRTIAGLMRNAGWLSACFNLGVMYNKGENVRLDKFKAVELYQKSCTGNDETGCNNLGVMYQNGEGVRLDLSKALSFYGKACDLKNQIGCEN